MHATASFRAERARYRDVWSRESTRRRRAEQRARYVVNPDFSAKGPHFSVKRKIFLLTVENVERALFARIQLGRSKARYPGRPRAFFGEPHVVTV
jgi:hypothetical protein